MGLRERNAIIITAGVEQVDRPLIPREGRQACFLSPEDEVVNTAAVTTNNVASDIVSSFVKDFACKS